MELPALGVAGGARSGAATGQSFLAICMTPAALDGRILLQTLALPDPAVPTDLALHFQPEGGQGGNGVRLSADGTRLAFDAGAVLGTDSYMNLFNLGTWSRNCRLSGLALRLCGRGRFRVRARLLTAWNTEAAALEGNVTLTAVGAEIGLDALLGPDPQAPLQDGVIVLRLESLEDGAELSGGGWLTACPDPAPVRLALVITTFRREAEVAASAARITGFLDASAPLLGAEVRLFVIDNGGTAAPAPHPRLTLVANPNLGGAGGFARGLAEAQDGGFTHALFMDDDAAMPLEALTRTLAFLRLARSPRAALAGAMISEARPWAMWENGAVFCRSCHPLFVGTDLRDRRAVVAMELAAAGPKPAHFYGGFWFFAFPVAAAMHFPFPFFVRGDDISFSLANRFDTATLNGVVSVQEDFSAKESPLTLYLDLRNHLHHHLVHPGLEIGAWGSAKVALRFLARSLVRLHYDSAEAQLAAWEDVMKGPEFFAENADMARRRPEISALARSEAWRDLGPDPAASAAPAGVNRAGADRMTAGNSDKTPFSDPVPMPPGRLYTLVMKFTLNGHLIPFWTRLGRRVTVPVSHRGLIWPLWGAAEAAFRDAGGHRGYTLMHSKRRFWRIGTRAAALTGRWIAAYPGLRAAHRAGYAEMTSRGFWERQFGAEGRSAPGTGPGAPSETGAAAPPA